MAKNLEETIKEKVSPLLEETMEKNWGVSIPKIEEDLTSKLKSNYLNIYVPLDLSLSSAKRFFKREYFKKEIKLNKGNISTLAKNLNLSRRSAHRIIKELGINVKKLRNLPIERDEEKIDEVDKKIRGTLEEYKEIIKPKKMNEMYKDVHKLSKNIARILPLKERTWKEAEMQFEKQFIKRKMKRKHNKIKESARDLRICPETLKRKIKKLKIS